MVVIIVELDAIIGVFRGIQDTAMVEVHILLRQPIKIRIRRARQFM